MLILFFYVMQDVNDWIPGVVECALQQCIEFFVHEIFFIEFLYMKSFFIVEYICGNK